MGDGIKVSRVRASARGQTQALSLGRELSWSLRLQKKAMGETGGDSKGVMGL